AAVASGEVVVRGLLDPAVGDVHVAAPLEGPRRGVHLAGELVGAGRGREGDGGEGGDEQGAERRARWHRLGPLAWVVRRSSRRLGREWTAGAGVERGGTRGARAPFGPLRSPRDARYVNGHAVSGRGARRRGAGRAELRGVFDGELDVGAAV